MINWQTPNQLIQRVKKDWFYLFKKKKHWFYIFSLKNIEEHFSFKNSDVDVDGNNLADISIPSPTINYMKV